MYSCFEFDKNGRVTKASLKSEVGKIANTSINAWVVKRKLLFNLINDNLILSANVNYIILSFVQLKLLLFLN